MATGKIDVVFNCHPRKFARILLSVACELWLRGQIARVEDVADGSRPTTFLFWGSGESSKVFGYAKRVSVGLDIRNQDC